MWEEGRSTVNPLSNFATNGIPHIMTILEILKSVPKEGRTVLGEVTITKVELFKYIGEQEPIKTKGDGFKYSNPEGGDIWFSSKEIVKVISATTFIIQSLAAKEGVADSKPFLLLKAV